MSSSPRRAGAVLVALLAALLGLAGCGGTAHSGRSHAVGTPDYALETAPPAPGSTVQPNPYEFAPRIDNPWFPLWPGTRMRYVEHTHGGARTEVVSVTRLTKVVTGVTTTVVRTVVRAHGRVVEVDDGWYAQDVRGNVWQFGRHVRSGSGAPGSWEAGAHGAKPVIVMPGRPSPGATYGGGQPTGWGSATGGAAKVLRIGGSVRVPYGRPKPVLQAKRVGAPGARSYYAKGVGLVLEQAPGGGRLELVGTSLFDSLT